MTDSSHPTAQAEKWDRHYKSSTNGAGKPSEVLLRNLHLIPTEGRALEIACGLGSNSLLLAAHGLTVEAWDISTVALEKLQQQAEQCKLTIKTRQVDVENLQYIATNFDLIIVSHFLHRPLCSVIAGALRPSGLLLYQTFCVDHLSGQGPRNPAFRLSPNELLLLFSQLQLVYYREESMANCSAQLQQTSIHNQACFIGQQPETATI